MLLIDFMKVAFLITFVGITVHIMNANYMFHMVASRRAMAVDNYIALSNLYKM